MTIAAAHYFEIGHERTVFNDNDNIAAASFARDSGFICAGGLSEKLLNMIKTITQRASFMHMPILDDGRPPFGSRSIETPSNAGVALSLALSRTVLLDWLSTVTGCGPLTRAEGRVVQTEMQYGDKLDWHRDTDDNRRLGITIHLDARNYVGGAFELRSVGTTDSLLRHEQAARGDVIIFGISNTLEHRVLPLTSGGPRRVYTGWFFGKDG